MKTKNTETNNKQIKACGYGRTSSEDVGSAMKLSVDVQKQDYLKACANNGWINQGWFEDRDVSGRAYPCNSPVAVFDTVTSDYLANKSKAKQNRQGLTKALESGASVLWVRDVTRFARPLSGSMLAPYLRSVLVSKNLKLWTGDTGEIDYSKLETKLVQSIQAEIEDHSIKTKAAQSKASKQLKTDNGYLGCSGQCYGYRNAGKQKVVAVESELNIVSRIFEMFLQGKTIRQIALHLQDTVQPMRGLWNRATIRQILSRPWYAGYSWDSSKNLVASKLFKATISLEDWQQVQNRLNSNTVSGTKEGKLAHPLSGLVYCGNCGKRMRPYAAKQSKTKHAHYYKCWGANDTDSVDTKECRQSLIRECISLPAGIDQEKGYLGEFKKGYGGSGLIEFLYPWTIAGYIVQLSEQDITPELLQQKEAIKAQIETLKQKTKNRYQDLESGFLDRDTYKSLAAETKTQEQNLVALLKKTETEIAKAQTQSKITMKDTEQLEQMNWRQYAALIRKVISGIYCYQDRIELELVENPEQRITFKRCSYSNSRILPEVEIGLMQQSKDKDSLTGGTVITYTYPKTKEPTTNIYYDKHGVIIKAEEEA